MLPSDAVPAGGHRLRKWAESRESRGPVEGDGAHSAAERRGGTGAPLAPAGTAAATGREAGVADPPGAAAAVGDARDSDSDVRDAWDRKRRGHRGDERDGTDRRARSGRPSTPVARSAIRDDGDGGGGGPKSGRTRSTSPSAEKRTVDKRMARSGAGRSEDADAQSSPGEGDVPAIRMTRRADGDGLDSDGCGDEPATKRGKKRSAETRGGGRRRGGGGGRGAPGSEIDDEDDDADGGARDARSRPPRAGGKRGGGGSARGRGRGRGRGSSSAGRAIAAIAASSEVDEFGLLGEDGGVPLEESDAVAQLSEMVPCEHPVLRRERDRIRTLSRERGFNVDLPNDDYWCFVCDSVDMGITREVSEYIASRALDDPSRTARIASEMYENRVRAQHNLSVRQQRGVVAGFVGEELPEWSPYAAYVHVTTHQLTAAEMLGSMARQVRINFKTAAASSVTCPRGVDPRTVPDSELRIDKDAQKLSLEAAKCIMVMISRAKLLKDANAADRVRSGAEETLAGRRPGSAGGAGSAAGGRPGDAGLPQNIPRFSIGIRNTNGLRAAVGGMFRTPSSSDARAPPPPPSAAGRAPDADARARPAAAAAGAPTGQRRPPTERTAAAERRGGGGMSDGSDAGEAAGDPRAYADRLRDEDERDGFGRAPAVAENTGGSAHAGQRARDWRAIDRDDAFDGRDAARDAPAAARGARAGGDAPSAPARGTKGGGAGSSSRPHRGNTRPRAADAENEALDMGASTNSLLDDDPFRWNQ